jgi:MerR family transcriptional regulator, light-induced transcriptional regulator
MVKAEARNKGGYRSGVAARLSGVPVDTLRIWERRYAVIGPQVSAGGQRLYSMADIRRLTLIKQLVDMGHSIGTIASLGNDELLDRQAASRSLQDAIPHTAGQNDAGPIKVALVGALIAGEYFSQALATGALEVVGRSANPANAAVELHDVDADVAIIELTTMRDDDLGVVAGIKSACGAASAIVLYRFATSALVRRMRMAGHAMARSTSDATELEAICLGVARRPRADAANSLRLLERVEPAPARFDEPTLAQLSGASRTIECECPRHLVDLVMSLGGFERYSAECASRSPSDARLHLELQRATALARSIMEQALERVAIAEGLAMPQSA